MADSDTPRFRVLFVCLGNICRSPMAEAIFRHLLQREAREGSYEVDSAGTGGWHVGESPDRRAVEAAKERGIRLRGHARQFEVGDFDRFDGIYVMDRQNLADVLELARSDDDRRKVRLLRSFDPASPEGAEVPDPYFGGADGFDSVIDILDAACTGLLEQLDAATRP